MHLKILFLLIISMMSSISLQAQSSSDACATCKNFCSLFTSPLSFNALTNAMNTVDEYCTNVQNPTCYDNALCQKYSSLKISFVKDFSIKSTAMEKLCKTTPPCKDECPASSSNSDAQEEDKKQDCSF